MEESSSSPIDKLYEWNEQLHEVLGDNTLFYIGIANTLILISIGSVITFVAAAAQKPGLAVASSSLFGVSAAVCMYMFTREFGPKYRSGVEDSIASVLTGGVVISILPLFFTNILELTSVNAFLSFFVSILVIILVVLLSNYYIAFFAEDA